MMRLPRVRAAVLALAAGAALAGGAGAQALRSSAGGAAQLELIRPLRLSVDAALAFGRASGAQGGTVTVAATLPATRTAQGATLVPGDPASPLVVTVTGEPRRAYRIFVTASVGSSPGGYAVSDFTVTSRTAGTVTQTRQAQLDATGSDRLLIGATLALPKGTKPRSYTATVPVTIAYE